MMNKFLSFLAAFIIILFVIAGVYSCSPTKTAVVEHVNQSIEE